MLEEEALLVALYERQGHRSIGKDQSAFRHGLDEPKRRRELSRRAKLNGDVARVVRGRHDESASMRSSTPAPRATQVRVVGSGDHLIDACSHKPFERFE